MRCYYCGHSLAALSLPLRRLEECPSCARPLHVCRMCLAYDPQVADACTEDDAAEVRDKERPNFCDYFRPNPAAFRPDEQQQAERAAADLAALFGEAAPVGEAAPAEGAREADRDPAHAAAEALFAPPKPR